MRVEDCPHRLDVRVLPDAPSSGGSIARCELLTTDLGSASSVFMQQCQRCLEGRDTAPETISDTELLQFLSVRHRAAQEKHEVAADCPFRGPQVGLRLCRDCKNKTRLKEFVCDVHGAKVVDRECQVCPTARQNGTAPSLSVILVALNEGPEVVGTVRSMWDRGINEIIVADDASTDGSTDDLMDRRKHAKDLPPIRLLKMKERMGCNPCRNIAGREADADVLAFMDAHMRISSDNLRRLGRAAHMLKGIVQAANRGMPITSEMRGCGVEWRETHEHLFELKWATRRPVLAYGPSDGVMGACYAIPKDIFMKLGGFMDNTGLWGFTEGVLTLKANLAEVPIYVSRDIFARHLYRGKPGQPKQPFAVPSNHPWMSRYAGLKIALEPDTFARMLPDLKAKHWDAEIEALLARPALQAEHEHFQKARKITDADFFARYLPSLVGRWTGTSSEFYINGVKQPGGMAAHYGTVFK